MIIGLQFCQVVLSTFEVLLENPFIFDVQSMVLLYKFITYFAYQVGAFL